MLLIPRKLIPEAQGGERLVMKEITKIWSNDSSKYEVCLYLLRISNLQYTVSTECEPYKYRLVCCFSTVKIEQVCHLYDGED